MSNRLWKAPLVWIACARNQISIFVCLWAVRCREVLLRPYMVRSLRAISFVEQARLGEGALRCPTDCGKRRWSGSLVQGTTYRYLCAQSGVVQRGAAEAIYGEVTSSHLICRVSPLGGGSYGACVRLWKAPLVWIACARNHISIFVCSERCGAERCC